MTNFYQHWVKKYVEAIPFGIILLLSFDSLKVYVKWIEYNVFVINLTTQNILNQISKKRDF